MLSIHLLSEQAVRASSRSLKLSRPKESLDVSSEYNPVDRGFFAVQPTKLI